jgi:hypothetical protein
MFYGNLYILLISVYLSGAQAQENQQDMVESPPPPAVFMPIMRNQQQPAVAPSRQSYLPLKNRSPYRSNLKKFAPPGKIATPSQSAVSARPVVTRGVPSAAAPAQGVFEYPSQAAPAKEGKNMTPDQAKQILSIYGTQH